MSRILVSFLLLATVAVAGEDPANKWLAALTGEQRGRAAMPFDDARRMRWHYTSGVARKGVSLREMTAAQRTLAHELLASVLSKPGYRKVRSLMGLEVHIKADPLAYFFAVFGKPGPKGAWGLAVEGHHLSLNFVFRDGKLASASPAFLGANPETIKDTRVLGSEEDLGFALLNALGARQRKRAIVSDRTAVDMNEANKEQTAKRAAVGIGWNELDEAQRKHLLALVKAHLSNQRENFVAAYLESVDLKTLHFAWYGGRKRGLGHSYRIQGDNLVILFFHARFNHSHSVWRTVGKDFGAP